MIGEGAVALDVLHHCHRGAVAVFVVCISIVLKRKHPAWGDSLVVNDEGGDAVVGFGRGFGLVPFSIRRCCCRH